MDLEQFGNSACDIITSPAFNISNFSKLCIAKKNYVIYKCQML